jgi:hypothetical protein
VLFVSKNACTASYAILWPFKVKGRHQKFDSHGRDQFQFRHDRDGGFARVRHLVITAHSDPRIPNTYYSQCAAPVFGLSLMRAPFFLGGIKTALPGPNLTVRAIFPLSRFWS